MIFRYAKNHLYLLIIVFILIAPAFYFFLKPGIYWNMHDDMQMIRQLEMEKCLIDGQIPCRWTPDLGYGYGFPLFNYYPPLPYIIGEPFRLLGFSFASTVKLTAFLQITLSALFMYLLCLQLTNPLNSLLGSLFYTYGPYHAVNIYIRGAMNEAWASVFFPLVFLFSKRFIDKNKFIDLLLLSISFTFILLSHNPMALIFAPFLILWVIYWLYQKYSLNFKSYLTVLIKFLISGIISIALSAFFTLPVLFENNLVQIDTMFQGYYNFSVHFVSLYQLFISNFWSDGPSVWGTLDGMSFSVGYLHWIIPTLGLFLCLILLILKKITIRDSFLFLLIYFFSLTTAFLAHEKSTIIWQQLATLQKIQFPWRFLNLTNFFSSLSVVCLMSLFFKKYTKIRLKILVSAILIVSVILLNFQKFYPVTSGPITDEQKFQGLAWNNQITSGIYDYLPKTASTAPKYPAKEYLDNLNPEVKYTIKSASKGTNWQFINLTLSSSTTITFPVLAFPEFKLYDFQKPLNYQIEPYLGRITVNLPAGEHQLYLTLHNTPIRIISNYISLLSWVLVLVYFFKLTWLKLLKFRK